VIEPGLYKHYKNQKLYRVLFVAEWNGQDAAPLLVPDEPIEVHASEDHGVYACRLSNDKELLTAKWSGNTGVLHNNEPVVIYVALYDDGRVAARSLQEFEERVDMMGGGSLPRFARVDE